VTTNEDRGLEVAAGILKLVAERDMAVKCEQSANDYCTEEGARHRKTVDELQRQVDALIGRAEKLEAAMLALVAAVEQGAPGNHAQVLNEALIRCREESGMIGADLCDS